MSTQLKFPRVEDYVAELVARGPNVDGLVRLSLRKPRQPGTGSTYLLYVTSSYLRDIGPGGDYQSTLIYVTFDHCAGTLTGVTHNDVFTENEAERLVGLIREAVLREQYQLAPGYYLNGR
jgi:hypothetical protein